MNGQELLTNSRMNAFQTCRRLHYNQYVLGVRKEPSEALRIGSAVHLGLDLLKQGRDVEAAIEPVRQNYRALIDGATDPGAMAVEYIKTSCLIRGWEWRWSNDPLDVVATELHVETPIVNPDTGKATPTYRYAGILDAIIRLQDKRLALMETKTTGESIDGDTPYWKVLRLDAQISRYMIAAREGGYDIRTVLYDVIRKPGIKPKLIKGIRETPAEYGERLWQDILDRPHFYYQRREIVRLKADLDETRAEMWELQKDIRGAELSGRHYRNARACRAPYPCPFLDHCSAGTDLTQETPAGFVRLNHVHPELEDETNASSRHDTAAAVGTAADAA